MKVVLAVIQPTKLDAVREALEEIEVERMTVSDAQGFGRPTGHSSEYPERRHGPALQRKVALEIVVNDDFLERTIEVVTSVARSGPEGSVGDGKLFVLPAVEAIQLNDGARGPGAV